MEIQIVNLLPPDIPYQVTKMKKQMKENTLYYDVKENEIQKHCDLYILIAGKAFSEAESWISMHQIAKDKIVVFASEHHKNYHCWSMPKAFEKEFDVEKMMQMLGCILMECPDMQLICSCDLKLIRFHKEASVCAYEERLKKYCGGRNKTEVHLFLKEKNKRILDEADMRLDVRQHWIRGVDSEVEFLIVKRKS